MFWFKRLALAAAAALGLAAPAQAATCPDPNVYPFTTGCPLPAAALNSAIAARMLEDGSNADFVVAGGTSFTTLAKRFGHLLNAVDDFGADNTGVGNAAGAIQALYNAASSTIGPFVPCGTYRVDASITLSGNNMLALGGGLCTNIRTSQTNSNVFAVTGDQVSVQGFKFTSAVVRTGGSYVSFGGTRGRLLDFLMSAAFIGVTMGGDDTLVDRGVILDTVAATGKSIVATNGAAALTIGYVVIDASHGSEPLAGIYADSVQDLTVGPTEIIHAATGLLVTPGNGQTVRSLNFYGTFFDTSSLRGIDLCPTGSGAIQQSRLANIWSASFFQTNALRICGGVNGVDIVDPQLIAAISSNLALTGGANVNVLGGQVMGAGAFGIAAAAGVSDFSIINVNIGAIGQFLTNASGGISVAGGASDRYIITNNRCVSQTACVTDGGTGVAKQVYGNVGQATEQYFGGSAGWGWFNSLGVHAAALTDAGLLKANAFFCGPADSPETNTSCAFGLPYLSTSGSSIAASGTATTLAGAISISTAASSGSEKARIFNSGGVYIGQSPTDPGANNLKVQGTITSSGGTALTATTPYTVTGGSTSASLAQRGSHVLSAVDDFGADNTGAADAAAAVQAWANSASATSGVQADCGTYKLNSKITLTGTNVRYQGAGWCTILTNNNATTTADTIEVSGTGNTVEWFSFNNSVARTGGAYVHFSGGNNSLVHFLMDAAFNGVSLTSGVSFVDHGRIYNTVATTGIGIYINDPVNAFVIGNDVIVDKSSGTEPRAGLFIESAGDVWVGASQFIRSGTGLIIAPGNGEVVPSAYFNSTFFDTNGTRATDICPTGTGAVVRIRFNQTWHASSGSGSGIRFCSTGSIAGADFIDAHVLNNAGGGITLAGGTGVNFIGGQCAQNIGNCATVSANVSNFQFSHMDIGAVAGMTTNTVGGINVAAGTSDKYIIAFNKFTTQANAITDGGTGVSKYVQQNPGAGAPYDGSTLTLLQAAPTVGASQVSLGSTTAAVANCGGAATACLVINVGGTTRYVPYY